MVTNLISIKLRGIRALKNTLDEQIKKLSEEGKDKKVDEMVDALRLATPVDTGKARDGWRVINDVIVNDVDYIDKLNEGTSQQAPSHFIERTLLAVEGVSPNGTIVR